MQDFPQSNKHKGDFHTLIFIKLWFNYGLPAHQQHAPDKGDFESWIRSHSLKYMYIVI